MRRRARSLHDIVKNWLGEDQVGLDRRQMKADERDAARRFTAGDLDILVATTVIEVGVNVPEATIMVIASGACVAAASAARPRWPGRRPILLRVVSTLAPRRNREGAPHHHARYRRWF